MAENKTQLDFLPKNADWVEDYFFEKSLQIAHSEIDLYHANMFAPSGVKYETTPYEQPQKQAKLPQECG